MDFTSLGLLIMRLGFASVIAIRHGLPKLLDFTNLMHTFPDPIGLGSTITLSLAVFSEFLCAILVALGFFTRYATIPVVATMMTAFFVVHGGDPFAKKELSFLFLTGFTSILVMGPGRFSLDAMFKGFR